MLEWDCQTKSLFVATMTGWMPERDTLILKPKKCESCGAPMKRDDKCEYCGMEYSIERVPMYDDTAKITLKNKNDVSGSYPLWAISMMRY